MAMHITWKDGPAPQPEIAEGSTLVTGQSESFPGSDLPQDFLAAARSLGQSLAQQGAAPPHIRHLTITAPSPQTVIDELRMIDLLFREALGGNFGKVALVEGPALSLSAYAVVPPASDSLVYGGYTAQQLNVQYSPRATVPEAADIMAQWRIDGTEYQKQRTAELCYGEDPAQATDLFMPGGIKNPPLHVFIHGGYWQALDKRDNGQIGAQLVKAGVAVAALNYPLCPPATVGQIICNCRQAIAQLYREADTYGYDATRMTISGHSAGGHLVAVMAATHWPTVDATLPGDLIKGTVAISGLHDLEPLRHTGLNNALGLTKQDTAILSPLSMTLLSNIPFIAAVGGAESDEFKRQSKAHADAFGSTYLELPGKNHFTVVEALADPDSPLFKRTLAMIEKT